MIRAEGVSFGFLRLNWGETYIIGSVNPQLLENGMTSYFVGSEGRRQNGYECGLHGRLSGLCRGSRSESEGRDEY